MTETPVRPGGGPDHGPAHDPVNVLMRAGRRVALRHPAGGKSEPVSRVRCSDGLDHLMVWHLDGKPVSYGALYGAAEAIRRGGQRRKAAG